MPPLTWSPKSSSRVISTDQLNKIHISFIPKDHQVAFKTVNAFFLELLRIQHVTKDPVIAMGKLEYWREAIRTSFEVS